MGTRNGIIIIEMISERAIHIQMDVYLCFIDYDKTFDMYNYIFGND